MINHPKEIKALCPQQDLHKNVLSSFIYNTPQAGTDPNLHQLLNGQRLLHTMKTSQQKKAMIHARMCIRISTYAESIKLAQKEDKLCDLLASYKILGQANYCD